MKRETEAKYKALSEIFDPKNNFKFTPSPYPNKPQELLDTELEEAAIIYRKPNSRTTTDLLSADHDPQLWAAYQEELRLYNLVMIEYKSRLSVLTTLYNLDLKAWSTESRENKDLKKALFTETYRRISRDSLLILEQRATFKKVEEDKDVEQFLALINLTHLLTPTADLAMDRVKQQIKFERLIQGQHESLTAFKSKWDQYAEDYVIAGGVMKSDADQALTFLRSLHQTSAVMQFEVELTNKVLDGSGAYPATVNQMYNQLYQRKVVVQSSSKSGSTATGELSFVATTVGKASQNTKKGDKQVDREPKKDPNKAFASRLPGAGGKAAASGTAEPNKRVIPCNKPCITCTKAGEPEEKAMHWLSDCPLIKQAINFHKNNKKSKAKALTLAELEIEEDGNEEVSYVLRDSYADEDLDDALDRVLLLQQDRSSLRPTIDETTITPVETAFIQYPTNPIVTDGEIMISAEVAAAIKASQKIKELSPTDWILDTGATMKQGGLAVSKAAVVNIRKAAKKTELRGIGTMVVTQCCDLPYVASSIHFDPRGPANILAFFFLEDKFPTVYSRDNHTFSFRIVHKVWLTFRRNSERLYIGNTADLEARCENAPPEPLTNRVLVNTVAHNASLFTKRENQQAEKITKLRKNSGFPSDRDLMESLQKGGIINNPLTPQDLNRERAIRGPDVHALKGKSVSHKADPVKVELIPRLISSAQALLIDLFFMNGLIFLISRTLPLRFVIVAHILAKSVSEVGKSLMRMIGMYRSKGVAISAVLTDREPAVLALEQALGDVGIKLQPASGDSVPEIERTIRVVKEKSRCIHKTLPFVPPRKVLIWLVLFAASAINMFASRHSETSLCPNTLLYGFAPDYNKHFKHGFGDYVQAPNPLVTDETKNTLMARTIGAIVLLVQHTHDASVKCLNLNTGYVITCRSGALVQLPMPPLVCEHLTSLAAAETPKSSRSDTSDRERQLFFEYRGAEVLDVPNDEDIEDGDRPCVMDLGDVAPISGHHIPPIGDFISPDPTQELTPPLMPGDGGDFTIAGVDFNPTTTAIGDQQPPVEDFDRGGALLPPTNNNVEDSSDHYQDPQELPLPSDIINDAPTPKSETARGASPQAPSPQPKVPARPFISPRKSGRATTTYRDRKFYVPETGLHMTVNSALRKLGRKALESVVAEIQQVGIDKQVFKPVNVKKLAVPQLKKVIRSSIFCKEKFLADGAFEKLKARLVAGGNMQDKALYEDVSSPTVSTSAAFIIAAIAASERRQVVAIDIPGAYLNADLSDNEPIHMRLNRLEAAILMQLDPSFEIGKLEDGSCIVLLNKALYGLIESAKLWYEHLSATLMSMGFVANDYDPCVFNITRNGVQCSICFHVDDLLVTSVDASNIAFVHEGLSAVYGNLDIKRGPKLSYLGMTFDFSEGGRVKISQEKFVADFLRESGVTSFATTPALDSLFTISLDSPPVEGVAKEQFHSFVAKLLYLAKRTRPDMLLLCSFLTTRVSCSTEEDQLKLLRGIRYLNKTQGLYLTLSTSNPIEVVAFTDASFGIHANFMSHTGATITLGGGPVFAKSSKQRLVTKSSTESELVGLSDSASQVIWTRNFLIAQGYDMAPAIIKQDNMSTLALAAKGRSTSERTRHVSIRYFFIKDRVTSGDLKLEYLPTAEMIADILTKPLQGETFRILRDALLNTHPVIIDA